MAIEKFRDGVEWSRFDCTPAVLEDVHAAAGDVERVRRLLSRFGGERFVKSDEAIAGIIAFAATIDYAAGAALVRAGVAEVEQ